VVLIALAGRQLRTPTGVPLKLALAAGVLDTVANVAMLLALQASLLSLAGCSFRCIRRARSRWRCWCSRSG
jgi:hypothetical protein